MIEADPMQAPEPRPTSRRLLARVPDWAILLVFGLLFSGQVVWTLQQKAATFDEPLNLVSGYISLRFGDARLIPQNLPFVKLLAAAPLLLFQDISLPGPPEPWKAQAQYQYASELLYKFNDADTLLLVGRLAVLPLSLLLGFVVFVWTRDLLGRAAATFALFLYSLEPNILAHSGLITTDIATACFMFLTIYGWYQLAQGITWTRILFPALTVGLGLLTKFTTLPLILIFLLIGTVVVMSPHPLQLRLRGVAPRPVVSRGGKLLACALLGLISALVAYATIWAAYGFRYETAIAPIETYHTHWRVFPPKSPLLLEAVLWAREVRLLPEPYLYGLTFMGNLSGHFQSYLMGDIRSGGRWYYFLVTFLMKTPIALMLLLVLTLVLQRRVWGQPSLRFACLAGPIVIYFLMISVSGWNIGHRHLLPIYPFLFILAGALVPWAQRQSTLVKGGLVALVCWYALASAWIAPHYLAYFNELVGGPDQGYHYLVDSNLDWGQDLKGLKQYMDQHGIPRVWLSYFGQADPRYYGITYDYLPSYDIFHPQNVRPQVWLLDRAPPPHGTVAISATLLQGAYLPFSDPAKANGYFEEYRRMTPTAKVGYSIFIYQME